MVTPPQTVTVRAPTRDDVAAAQRRLEPLIAPTPVVRQVGGDSWLKLENLQVTGAYKVRGALNAIAASIERGDRRPIVAASAGNHGKGVAWASRAFGIDCHIVVPSYAPEAKVAGTIELGAQVTRHGASFEDAERFARTLALDSDWHFIHPFDDPDVIVGQGTVAAELDQLSVDTVVVPIGGGGLAAGVCLWLKHRSVRVIGAQVEGVDAMARTLRGEANQPPHATVADGLAVAAPGTLTIEICRELLDELVLVTEQEVHDAMRRLLWQDKLLVEGAGAVAVAALPRASQGRTLAVVTGGNLDRDVLEGVMKERGLQRRRCQPSRGLDREQNEVIRP